MTQRAGKRVGLSFDASGLTSDDVTRLTADMWADLPFDRDALANLQRDGLILDGINLGGPCPYRIATDGDGKMVVTAPGQNPETLLDLWRMHFLRGLRSRSIAA